MLTKEGFPYAFDPSACASCNGNCCRGESGYIWVNDREMHRLADFLGISLPELIRDHLERVGRRFSIRERKVGEEYFCRFFSEKEGCMVYDARPEQCRTFPFWEHFLTHPEELEAECPGVRFF